MKPSTTAFGASDGSPRQEVDPIAQIRDYRDAITFAETLPGTDPARIGVWGSSYSGGHVLIVAAIDRRVKCVVSQVPMVSGLAQAALFPPEMRAVAIVAQNAAHGPALDIAIDAILPGIDLDGGAIAI